MKISREIKIKKEVKKMRKKLKLTTLSRKELVKAKGGFCGYWGKCGCGCMYEGQPGGSSTGANLSANHDDGKHSPICPVK